MSGVSVAKKNGGQTSAIFANDTRWRPNSQILHMRDRSNSRVTETARPSGVPPSAARPSGVLLGGIRASVPRSTIITQGRQAITESRGRYRVHNFSKPVTHKQKHRNRRISAQNVKNVLKCTPINVSLPGNAVLRHNCTQKFHLACNSRIPNVYRTSNLPVSINVICSRGITRSGTRSFPKSWLIR